MRATWSSLVRMKERDTGGLVDLPLTLTLRTSPSFLPSLTAAAQRAKACMMLSSNLRWCCTGTPIGNDVVDLLGQFAVIGMSPFSLKTFFDVNVKQAFGAQGERVRLGLGGRGGLYVEIFQ